MGNRYEELSEKHIGFIAQQKIFFVGTATADSRVNISPKGMNSFRVLSERRAVWLNVTGSGNETSAHVQYSPRMTIMFCAFDGLPLILRLYGTAKVTHRGDPEWEAYRLDQGWRDFGAVHLFQVSLHFTHGHATGIQRQDILVEAVPAGLVLGDELRLEAAIAVTGYFDRQFAELALERFAALTVAGVACGVVDRLVLGVTGVRFHLGIQRSFNECLGELLEQAVLAYQIFRFLIARQQAVN